MNGNGALPTPSALHVSWKALHLSRAKLKAINKTSAMMAGFAMVAMTEIQINEDTQAPSILLTGFVICTSLLVAVHMLALMISVSILPSIDAVANLHNIDLVEESPHDKLHWFIEVGWGVSTALGTFLFILEVIILCWVKFYDYSLTAASSATVIMVPITFLFVAVAIYFYRKLIAHKFILSERRIEELEEMQQRLNFYDARNNRRISVSAPDLNYI